MNSSIIRLVMGVIIALSSLGITIMVCLSLLYYYNSYKCTTNEVYLNDESEILSNEKGDRMILFTIDSVNYNAVSIFSYKTEILSDHGKVEYFYNAQNPNKNFLNLKEDETSARQTLVMSVPLLLLLGVLLPYLLIRIFAH